jgi:hypothetical protein
MRHDAQRPPDPPQQARVDEVFGKTADAGQVGTITMCAFELLQTRWVEDDVVVEERDEVARHATQAEVALTGQAAQLSLDPPILDLEAKPLRRDHGFRRTVRTGVDDQQLIR